MRVVIVEAKGAVLGKNLGHPCAEVCAVIELSFREVSRVSHGVGVVVGVHVPQVQGAVLGVWHTYSPH